MSDVHDALRAAWDADTCDPVDLPWSPQNPSRGQCGVTALVLHDHFGGELLVAEVLRDDGTRQGFHIWNRLPDGTEVDLTWAQFGPDEHVQEARILQRDGPPRRCAEQYDLLRARVAAAVQPSSTVASASSGPSSARNSR
jgi:hypothetical protein